MRARRRPGWARRLLNVSDPPTSQGAEMTESTYNVVQFIHPGFEYPLATQASGVMPWKDGRAIHNRKFLLSRGSYVDIHGQDNRSVPIVFWGEWEGPSILRPAASASSPSGSSPPTSPSLRTH